MLTIQEPSTGLDQLRLASRKLQTDAAERGRLQDDPVGYLSGLGIELHGETAEAVRRSALRAPGGPRQAAIVHIDA